MIQTEDFGDNPGALIMLSEAPAGLAPGAPLVVVLHGCTQDAQANAAGSGWLQLAAAFGFVVLCPVQQTANNPNRCFNWFQPQDATRDQGEAASIRQMIAAAVAAHRCDPRQVFIVGLSAGGAMAAVMMAVYPEVFAGGGVVAGLPFGAAQTVQEAFGAMIQGRKRTPQQWGDLVRDARGPEGEWAGPWPRVSIWHGDADAVVKPVNADALAQQWADVHGAGVTPARTTAHGLHRRDVWLSPAGAPVVELNIISGLGHGTPLATFGPDGWGAPGPFLLEAGVSSSLELLRFWGVAPTQAVKATSPEAVGASTRPAFDLQAVLAKAFAAAGLSGGRRK